VEQALSRSPSDNQSHLQTEGFYPIWNMKRISKSKTNKMTGSFQMTAIGSKFPSGFNGSGFIQFPWWNDDHGPKSVVPIPTFPLPFFH
jgi:hypothetical protein